jgi:hypothetical protein
MTRRTFPRSPACGALARGLAAAAVAGLPACASNWDPLHPRDAGALADATVDSDAAGLPDTAVPPVDGPRPDAPPARVDLRGCVLHLGMDEAQWTGALGEVVDDCGTPNSGQATGGVTTAPSGMVGRAASFVGAGCVRIENHAELHATTELTMAAWLFPTAATDGNTGLGVIGKRRDYGNGTEYTMFLLSEARVHFDVDVEDNPRSPSPNSIPLNHWTHVAIVYRGGEAPSARVRLYLDGRPEATLPASAAAIAPETSTLWIGCLPYGDAPAQSFRGMIDEVYLWNRALADGEIDVLYRQR